ncbi:MAG: glycosyltransferase [Lutibacter sp.]|nr:MAG: glycosyltransferase [Lutibacter sp.]
MMSVNIANAVKTQDVESYLCATREEGALKQKLDNDVKYIFLKRKRSFDISAILRLRKYIKNNKIDIIHAHSSSYFISSIVKLLTPNVKLIWHDHYGDSEHLKERKKNPLKMLSRYFYAIISVNNLLKKWSKNNLKAKNVYYVPNFASLSDASQKTVLKGEKGKRIICLAGFRSQKDHLNLLKAFKIVLDLHPNWTLHLVGNQYGDDYFKSVKDYIDRNDLLDNSYMYHNVIDIKNILTQSTIGVLSSKSEGLPVSLLEYGLAKLPVIVTKVGECERVLVGGKFGMLVSPSDEKMLAINIEEMISNFDLRNRFSDEFHQHIIENYSEQKIIHKLLDIYKS